MSTSNDNVAKTYTAHRNAGELFARLRDLLGFGELSMSTWTWCHREPLRAIEYVWTFNAQGKRYGCSETLRLDELEHMQSCAEFAQHLSETWKEHHRCATGK